MELLGKVAVVTGASRGMGLEISKTLGQAGIKVAMLARDPDRLAKAVQEVRELGGEAEGFPTDVREWDQVERTIKDVVARFGTVDIAVNAVFWGPPVSIAETNPAFWYCTIDTTLKGPFFIARAVTPVLQQKGSGRIINIGSLAGKVGEDNRTAYCAAKWGLEGLSAALREELKKYNVHVNLISPAATDTPWWREVGAELTPEQIARMIPPQVVASAVLWVISQPDNVSIPDIPIFNFRNPFEGKGSPFES